MRLPRSVLVLAGVVVALSVVAVSLGYWQGWFADPSVENAPEVRVTDQPPQTLATGLEAPWGLAFLPDGSALVTERDSKRLLSVTKDGKVTEVQRITEAVPGGEGGLLGVAVAPTYDQDKWVYVYYTTAEDNRIARLRLGGRPEPIRTGLPRAANHDGGRLAFGPDGMLYAGTGDAGNRDAAQDKESLGGKILRMTPTGDPAPGNPFGDSPVYSYGHRNVQGLAWDRGGQLFATEFGQNRYDELNRIKAGANYGWPEAEGPSGDRRFVDPVATWATSDASPSGLAIIDERAYLACLKGQRLYRIGLRGDAPEALLTGQYGRLRHVAAAPDGSIWLLTSNRDGRGEPTADDDRLIRLTAP
jgi:glucose/arabinose dehydrogenase